MTASIKGNKEGDKKKVNVYEQLDGFGRFQTIQYALICFPLIFVAMMNVNYVFVAAEEDYRCVVPECESTQNVNRPLWWPKDTEYKCLKPMLRSKFHNGSCSNTSFSDQVDQCREWIYASNNSIFGEMNLACQSWKATMVGSIHNSGMIISMFVMGWVSDRFGRKPSVIICSIGGFVGIVKSFMTSYNTFLVLEFIESVLSSGLYTVAIVLMIEAGGHTKRVLAGVIFSYAVYIGEALFAVIAMFVPYWRHLVLIVYSPTIIFITYTFLLRESTRWQLIKGKMDGAKSTLKKVAKMNRIEISDNEINDLNDDELRNKFNVANKKDKVCFKDVMGSAEIMRRLSVATFCFFSAGFVYYGLTVHSVLLPGNKHVNFILATVTSFPGDLLAYFTFNKFGRRISLMCGFVACAIFCVATAYSPKSIPWLKVTLFLCGKLAVALCFTGMYTYSLELFPTNVRGSLVGLCNIGARIGSMLAPITPLLSPTMDALPSILFAASTILAGVLLVFTPETKHLPLVDTIEQMEKTKDNNVVTSL